MLKKLNSILTKIFKFGLDKMRNFVAVVVG